MSTTENQTVDEAAASFDQAWEEFFAAMRRVKARAAREAREGLSLPQYQLLCPLLEADELTVGALAEAGGVAAPTATRMLDRLERDGLVERRASESDRRSVSVVLTRKGRRVVAARRELIAAKRRAIFDSLSPDERARAEVILRRLAAALEEL